MWPAHLGRRVTWQIGGEIRKLVDEFQAHTKSHQKLESIADMKVHVQCVGVIKLGSGWV
jgi:hypothetical protein